MKKLLPYILILFIVVFKTTVCYAGDVPEGLLNNDTAQVYFGEVKSADGDSITVIQKKNIKGEFTEDKEYTYADYVFTASPQVGDMYLCGFYDENNPLYIWEVTGLETDTLKIKNTDDMSKRMEQYLNEGKFEEKEAERLSKTDVKDDAKPAEEAPTEKPVLHEEQKGSKQDTKGFLFILIPAMLFIAISALICLRKRRN